MGAALTTLNGIKQLDCCPAVLPSKRTTGPKFLQTNLAHIPTIVHTLKRSPVSGVGLVKADVITEAS